MDATLRFVWGFPPPAPYLLELYQPYPGKRWLFKPREMS